MASISKQPNGGKIVQFVAADSRRPMIRLGKVSMAWANEVKRHVDALRRAQIEQTIPEKPTLEWVSRLEPKLRKRLYMVGLIEQPAEDKAQEEEEKARAAEQAKPTLGEYITAYIATRTDVRPATATVYGHTQRCLVKYFGADKPLGEITEGDAVEWRLWLSRPKGDPKKPDPAKDGEGLADNTVRRRCGIAKQFFRAAQRKRLIKENPFEEMKGCLVRENRERDYFVTQVEAEKALGACPDAEWRLLFALSRFGGLRCPSEHLGLRWQDIDWELARITVRSPKTAHHADGGIRQIPIFSELRPYLEDVFELAKGGSIGVDPASFIITRYRDAKTNLRTQLQKIIKRAGLILLRRVDIA